MKKICAYTCITGNYDNLHEVEVLDENVDYLCFTNNKNLKSNTWKMIYIEDEKLDNHRLSRKIKMLGHPIIDENYDISVWMDASVVFDKKITDFVRENLKKNPFAAFKHSYRDCIYDEAIECLRKKKDTKESISNHLEFLEKEGYPKKNGLFEMTVFIKKHHNKKVRETMQLWFDMVCKYSRRDQLSFMYCVWKTGLKIDSIPLSVWDNEWFHCFQHNYKEKLDTCKIYFGKDTDFEMERYEVIPYQIKQDNYSFSIAIPKDTKEIEIELSDIPCVEYSNLTVEVTGLKQANFYNTTSFFNRKIFYNNAGIIQLVGDFKQNDTLSVCLTMKKLEKEEIYSFIEYLGIKNITYKNENDGLKEQCESLLKDNSKIRNSIFWKITKPFRMLTEIFKRK